VSTAAPPKDRTAWSETDCSRAAGLAMTGLATKLSSPALLHTLKGHLHNLAMLTELLQQEAGSARELDVLRAGANRRAKTLRAEIDAMNRNLRLLESLAGWQELHDEHFCEVHTNLAEVLQAVRVEAARRQVQVRLEVMSEPTLIVCSPSAFQQVVLTCTIYTIQRCRRGEAVVIAGETQSGVTMFDFLGGELDAARDEIDYALDLDLLATLASMAGARFVPSPTMRVAFRTASH
jgi:hypothetical protein